MVRSSAMKAVRLWRARDHEVGVLRVLPDEPREERTGRDHLEPAPPDVVERIAREPPREAVVLELGLDLGVEDRDRVRVPRVDRVPGQLAADVDLVAQAARVVGDQDVGHTGSLPDCSTRNTTSWSHFLAGKRSASVRGHFGVREMLRHRRRGSLRDKNRDRAAVYADGTVAPTAK